METNIIFQPQTLAGALTKESQENIAEQFVTAVLDGDINPLEAFARMKAMNEALAKAIKDTRLVDAVVDECGKWGKQTPEWQGVKFAVREVGVKYDFSVCNDPEWEDITRQIDKLTERRKERETFLKSIKGDMQVADATTGEMLNPPAKISTTSVSVTFKKA